MGGGSSMPRVAFTTLGCKVNQFETEVMEGLFKHRNYEIVDFTQTADVYIINTCSVTHLGERKSRQLIRRASRLNPSAVIAVAGCYSQVSPEEVQAIEGVKVIVGTQDRNRIVELVEQAAQSHEQVNAVGDIMKAQEFEDIPLFNTPGRTRAFLKIQEGCTNFCTYCIIPYARGPLRSRSMASIIQEAGKLITAGFKEIVLTGIHLGAYGRDLNETEGLVGVIKAILDIPGIIRLRLGSLESIEVSNELLAIMQQDERFCHHLHLPLQSGTNEILRSMNRHYTTDDYQRLIKRIVHHIPDVAISTDVIVGFPGETDEYFNSSLEFIKSMNFARVHVFPYSRRKGTPAAGFSGQNSEQVKKHRVQILQEAADQKASLYRNSFLLRQVPVLFETCTNGVADGLTGNYLRVYCKSDNSVLGTVRTVRLDSQYEDGLWGTIMD